MTPRSFTAFRDELEKIAGKRKLAFGAAMTGGLIGAGVGSAMPGNGIRNGIIGGAVGAAAGGAFNFAKRQVFDPNHQRSAYLASLPPPGDPNYVPTWQQGSQ